MSNLKEIEKFDIFISYQWNIKKKVEEFCDKLNKTISCLKIWRDDDNHRIDDSSVSDQLAKAIRNSKIIVCFITKYYALSKYCMRELKFADKLNKRIIFLLINKLDFVKSDEIQFIIAERYCFNCYENPVTWIDESFNYILQTIEKNIEVNKVFKNDYGIDKSYYLIGFKRTSY